MKLPHISMITLTKLGQVTWISVTEGVLPSSNPPGIPSDEKKCCGNNEYLKYVNSNNDNKCYEKQSNGNWKYVYGSKCDQHIPECYRCFCSWSDQSRCIDL